MHAHTYTQAHTRAHLHTHICTDDMMNSKIQIEEPLGRPRHRLVHQCRSFARIQRIETRQTHQIFVAALQVNQMNSELLTTVWETTYVCTWCNQACVWQKYTSRNKASNTNHFCSSCRLCKCVCVKMCACVCVLACTCVRVCVRVVFLMLVFNCFSFGLLYVKVVRGSGTDKSSSRGMHIFIFKKQYPLLWSPPPRVWSERNTFKRALENTCLQSLFGMCGCGSDLCENTFPKAS